MKNVTRNNKEIVEYRERVLESKWPEKKKKAFLDYQDYLVATDKSERTQTLYTIHVFQLGEFFPKMNFEDYTEKDTMKFKTELMKKYAPYSIHNEMLDIITFYKWHLKLDGAKPACLKWYNVSDQGKKTRKKYNPLDVLTEEDIKKIVGCMGSKRNKAIAFTLFETGCRIDEFLNIRVKDLVFEEKIVSIYISKGKTRESERTVFLINSVPTLKDWFDIHIFNHDPEAYLFYGVSKKNEGKRLYSKNVWSMLTRAAKRAKINKPVNPHALRRARATDLDRKRHSKRLVEQLLGWSPNSRMHSFYSQISAQDVKNGLMEDAGIISTQKSHNNLKPIECPFCQTMNSPEAMVCKNLTCLRPITEKGVIEEKKKKEDLMKELIRGEFKTLKQELNEEREKEQVKIHA